MASDLPGRASLSTQRPIRLPGIHRGLPLVLVRIWWVAVPGVLLQITRPSPCSADTLTPPCVDRHFDPNVPLRCGGGPAVFEPGQGGQINRGCPRGLQPSGEVAR